MISVEQRDSDIHTLAAVNKVLSQSRKMRFLISGSYALEALTQAPIDHGDMDTNIFTPDIPEAKVIAQALLSQPILPLGLLLPYKQTPDRLEYDVKATNQVVDYRRLEIHLVEALQGPEEHSDTYVLTDSKNHKVSQVNLVDAGLRDSLGHEYLFKVKSLAYSLATWALRISGVVKNQLRPVRDTDLESFSLLLTQDFSLAEVNLAMVHHPQMPENTRPEEVFQIAQEILKRNKT